MNGAYAAKAQKTVDQEGKKKKNLTSYYVSSDGNRKRIIAKTPHHHLVREVQNGTLEPKLAKEQYILPDG